MHAAYATEGALLLQVAPKLGWDTTIDGAEPHLQPYT